MFRTRRFRTLLAIPLAVSLVLLAPTRASADEDEDAPKRVRIEIVKESEEQAAHGSAQRADPMHILHDWFSAELQRHTPEGKGLEEGLAAWFAQGKDAPGAGLRDAFKAKGWDAEKLGRWLSGHAAPAQGMTAHGGPMHGMGMQGMRRPGMARASSGWRMRAPHARPPMGPGMLRRGPWQRGQGMQGGRSWGMQHGRGMHGGRGWGMQHGHGMRGGRGRNMQHGHGMNRGARMGQGTGRGRYAPQSDCPDCRHQGARTHDGFGQGPMPRGPMQGSGGAGPFHRRGPGAGPNTGHTMGGMPHGTLQRDARAYIMWNDGHGWQRMELAPGAQAGPQPFQGPARGMAPGHGRMDGPRAKGPNFIKRLPARPSGAGVLDLDQVRTLLQMLEGASKGAGKPGAAGQPGEPGRVGGLDPAKLKAALEILKQFAPQGGGYAIQSGPGGPGSWLELFRRAAPEKPAAQPKRVKIKSAKPKKVEVIEEIEIK